jgi:hypothetical protein
MTQRDIWTVKAIYTYKAFIVRAFTAAYPGISTHKNSEDGFARIATRELSREKLHLTSE